MEHRNGRVAVRYMKPVTADTLLESVGERAAIAQLVFTSADGKARTTYSIASSEQSRSLSFVGDNRISFVMDKGWENFWK
jgi:hypothetical protein